MADPVGTQSSAVELRNFGLVLGALLVVFVGLLPLLHDHRLRLWPVILSAGLWAAALVAPRMLAWPHRLWSLLGEGLGWVNTRVILGAFYFLMVTPFGLLMRLVGRDPLTRKFDPSCESYAVPSEPRSRESMGKPY
jgi:Saxitoxin biosynthesis operon protein SxtJ